MPPPRPQCAPRGSGQRWLRRPSSHDEQQLLRPVNVQARSGTTGGAPVTCHSATGAPLLLDAVEGTEYGVTLPSSLGLVHLRGPTGWGQRTTAPPHPASIFLRCPCTLSPGQHEKGPAVVVDHQGQTGRGAGAPTGTEAACPDLKAPFPVPPGSVLPGGMCLRVPCTALQVTEQLQPCP